MLKCHNLDIRIFEYTSTALAETRAASVVSTWRIVQEVVPPITND